MSPRWWCSSCWADLPNPLARCARCGFDPAADSRDFTDKLVATLRHPLPDRAVHAAATLGRLGERKAVPALCEALRAPDPYLQAEAAAALERLGDPRAVPALAGLLMDGGLPGRLAAARALGALGGEGATAALRRAAASDPSPAVARLARGRRRPAS